MSFFHVVGSATGAPMSIADATSQLPDAADSALRYHYVVLGSEAVGSNGSSARTRWLTHAEISTGVLRAIEQGESRFVVGRLIGSE